MEVIKQGQYWFIRNQQGEMHRRAYTSQDKAKEIATKMSLGLIRLEIHPISEAKVLYAA